MKEEYLYIVVGAIAVIAIVASIIVTGRAAEENQVIFSDQDMLDEEQGAPEGEQASLDVYFSNEAKDGSFRCTRVFSAERLFSEGVSYGELLQALFNGPTPEEVDEGYFTNVPSDVRVIETILQDGILTVTLNNVINTVAGSCRVEAIRSQIEQTLLQFSDVEEVIIDTPETSSDETLQP